MRQLAFAILCLFLLGVTACGSKGTEVACPAQAPRAGLQAVYTGPTGGVEFGLAGNDYFGQIVAVTATGVTVFWEHLAANRDMPASQIAVEGTCSASYTGKQARYVGPASADYPTPPYVGTIEAVFPQGYKVKWPALRFTALVSGDKVQLP